MRHVGTNYFVCGISGVARIVGKTGLDRNSDKVKVRLTCHGAGCAPSAEPGPTE